MFRKIILGFLLYILLTSNIFAVCNYCQTYCDKENRTPASLFIGTKDNNAQKQVIANKYHKNNKIICSKDLKNPNMSSELDKFGLCSSEACLGSIVERQKAMKEIQSMYDKVDGILRAERLAADKARQNIPGSKNMASKDFEVSTTQLLGDNKLKDASGNAKKTINTTLGTVIQKLMIALGSIALLIMTIGAGYMIMYSGHDELLSKGKSIFNAGIISLVVSLLSYYLVSLLRFILYS